MQVKQYVRQVTYLVTTHEIDNQVVDEEMEFVSNITEKEFVKEYKYEDVLQKNLDLVFHSPAVQDLIKVKKNDEIIYQKFGRLYKAFKVGMFGVNGEIPYTTDYLERNYTVGADSKKAVIHLLKLLITRKHPLLGSIKPLKVRQAIINYYKYYKTNGISPRTLKNVILDDDWLEFYGNTMIVEKKEMNIDDLYFKN